MEQAILAKLRKEKKYTQEQMANMLGISISAYNLYENGGRKVPEKIATKIAQILGANKDEIFLPQTFAVRKSQVDKPA
ncbi:MAG: putative transcriptional regulator [Caldanaerobacter sp.]|nr:putative transcriptional regulator [Caldanaerobacter sp.]